MGDVERALAFVARRRGTRSMPAQAWALTLSLELGWMPPGAAKAFVERARRSGLLRPQSEAPDAELGLAVDPAAIEVPPRFRPDPAAVPEAGAAAAPEAEGFLAWVDKVASARKASRTAVLQDVAALQARMGGDLTADVAVLWLARESGLDVRAAARRLVPPGAVAG